MLVGIIALIVLGIFLLIPRIGAILAAALFVIVWASGNYFLRLVGLGNDWTQFILVILLFLDIIFYSSLYILKESEVHKAHVFSYVMLAWTFIYRLSSEETLMIVGYFGLLIVLIIIFAIPVIGAVVSVVFFVIMIVSENPDFLPELVRERADFLPELFIIFFACSLIYVIIGVFSPLKKFSLIHITCFSLPIYMIASWYPGVYNFFIYLLILGVVAGMCYILLKIELVEKTNKGLNRLKEKVDKLRDGILEKEIERERLKSIGLIKLRVDFIRKLHDKDKKLEAKIENLELEYYKEKLDKLIDKALKEDGEDNILERLNILLTDLRTRITNSNIYQNQKMILRILLSFIISIVVYSIMVLFFSETRLISLLIPFSKYPGITLYSLIFTIIIPLLSLFILVLLILSIKTIVLYLRSL